MKEKLRNVIVGMMAAVLTVCLYSVDVRAEREEGGPKIGQGLSDYTELYGLEPQESEQHIYNIENAEGRAAEPRKVSYLAVFIEFKNSSDQIDDAETIQWADRLLNSETPVTVNYGNNFTMDVPSMRKYVEQYTYGKISTVSSLLPKDPANTNNVLAYTALHEREYYMPYSESNPNGYSSSDEEVRRERELAKEAIIYVNTQLSNGTVVIDPASLDSDGDGFLDAISFFIAGTQSDLDWGDLLWPHKISIGGGADLIDGVRIMGKKVNAWNLMTGQTSTNNESLFSGNYSTYGVIIHEYMHILGLPDLYRGYAQGDPVGTYDVMGSTLQEFPQPVMAALTSEYPAGNPQRWHNELPAINASGTYTVKKPSYSDPGEQNAVKIYAPGSETEYFIAEYYDRNQMQERFGGMAGIADSDGLLLSRMNTEYSTNINGTRGNDMLYIFRPSETVPNAGGGDLSKAVLSKAKGRASFGIGDTSVQGQNTICYSDGKNSGMVVQVVEESENSVTFQVKMPAAVNIEYQTHVQTYGWQPYAADGAMSGTSGEAKRLEGIRIRLRNQDCSGSIIYRTHVQTHGWQDWKRDDEMSGTSGEAKRLEAIQIDLTDQMKNYYDVYYRVHAQTYGWLDWAKNGEPAGTAGYAKRLEAIEIKVVPKGSPAPGKTGRAYVSKYAEYRTHVQTYGWQPYVCDGEVSGTTGQSKRLEGIMIRNADNLTSGDVLYRTHIQTYGWEEDWKKNGAMSGTSGQAKRLEAIQIKLEGDLAAKYDVYYRVHAQTYGWLDWAKNGESAGTAGYAKRLEGIQIVYVPKNGAAPGSTNRPYVEK
ncbi:MAG: hypothetical protein HFH11_04050 [Dorea sp.]|jgi:M6 family metalloprotease-like protein|nr:hypothetical protein [Dorea sp.]